ncbi:MAG TPA: LytTR family transcriptional regulator DNA-binding domain-containing protein [Fulvivirga sp.]|nr:LytTR family transcriptional regulator DNA-binding domain-containing protein [Fulvivirga sp.]
MTAIRVGIIEDEMVIAEDIRDILESNEYEVCGIAKNYEKSIEMIDNCQPDIVLLDIKIKGDKDGIDLARTLRSDYNIPFVFISSHSDSQTVKRAAEVNPYGYLVKPFEDPDVLVAVEIALSNFQNEQDQTVDEDRLLNNDLFVRMNNLSVKIPLDDIKYIKADGNYSQIQTKGKSYVMRSTLKDIEAKLDKTRFYRTHKSYIVNLNQLTAINSEYVIIDEEKLPIGRDRLQHLMDRINKL